MSITAFGSIVSDKIDTATHLNAVLPNMTVSLYSPSGGYKLGSAVTNSRGEFGRTPNGGDFFNYRRDPNKTGPPRTLELVVQDSVGREVFRSEPFQDTSQDTLEKWNTVIKDVEARGFLVTLGTGETGPQSGGGWGLTQGATVKFLIDNEAFKKAAEMFAGARDLIYFSQLFFPVPTVFNTDATKETTKLIFDFHPPAPDAAHLRAAGVGDSRPERLLLEAADRDVDIRILLHAFEVPLIIKIFFGLLVFPFAGSDGVSTVVGELLDSDLTDADEDRKYFADAGRSSIKVRPFEQHLLSAGVMHPKLMIVDAERALSIGSPFGQSYIDSHSHPIDEPVRGNSDDFPKHDAGFIVKGPVIGTIYNTLKLLWDTAAPDDKLQDYSPTSPDSHHGASVLPDDDWDATCSIQIVQR